MQLKKITFFQCIVLCLLGFILVLFILAGIRCQGKAFLQIRTRHVAFSTTAGKLPLYDGIAARAIQVQGLTVYAEPVKILLRAGAAKTEKVLLESPGRVSVESAGNDPVMLSAEQNVLRPGAMEISDSYAVAMDWQQPALAIGINNRLTGKQAPRIVIETGGNFTITGSHCTLRDENRQLIAVIKPDEQVVFYLKEAGNLKLSTDAADFLLKLFFAQETKAFPFMDRTAAMQLTFYEQPAYIYAHNSPITGGMLALSAPGIFPGNNFLIKEVTINPNSFLRLAPAAGYSIDQIICTGEGLDLSCYSSQPGNIKVGKYTETMENVMPSVLDYLFMEPVLKQVWGIFAAVFAFLTAFIGFQMNLNKKEKAQPVAPPAAPPGTGSSKRKAIKKKYHK